MDHIARCLLLLTSLVLVEAMPRVEREAPEISQPVVQTSYGAVKGRRLDVSQAMDIDIFLGIPYAKPPVGDLRLARPEPHERWDGTRDAMEHGAKCVQRIIKIDQVLENVPFSEDCLFLDIYTPSRSQGSTTKYPTMMFVHGGGYYGGSGAKYNFTEMAMMGVTMVSVSFRLDVFGFLTTEDSVIPGNFGLMDTVLALDWIRGNIQNFGGDPNDITLFGGSSGATSVSILSLSPLAKGKFQKAILMSGASLCPWAVHDPDSIYFKPSGYAMKLGMELNCTIPETNFSQELLDCLRMQDAQAIVDASTHMQEKKYVNMVDFLPVVETTFGLLPDTPINLLQNSNELTRIPTILGYTSEDGSWFVSDKEGDGVTLTEFKGTVNSIVQKYITPDDQAYVYEEALKRYLPEDPSSLTKTQLGNILIKIMTEALFVGGPIQEAKLFKKAATGRNAKTYVYEFGHRPSYSPYPEWMGVVHGDEKGFYLGLTVGPDPFMFPHHNQDDEEVSQFVMKTWTNFAKSGNPTPQPVQGITWPEFDADCDHSEIMFIETPPMVKKYDRPLAASVWGGLYKDEGNTTNGSDNKDDENTCTTNGSDNKDGGNAAYRSDMKFSILACCLLMALLLIQQMS